MPFERYIQTLMAVSILGLTPLEPSWSSRIPIVTVSTSGKAISAIVDTGGITESRKRSPRDFATYYSGLPIELAIGVDYLRRHVVTIGKAAGPSQSVPLSVRTESHLTSAFVRCRLGRHSLLMLLDTAALAWRSADLAHSAPFAVVFLRPSQFQVLERNNIGSVSAIVQIADEEGGFRLEPSITTSALICPNAGRAAAVTIVRRDDATTFLLLKRIYHLDIDGDVSLAASPGKAVAIDFPRQLMFIYE